MLIPIEHSLTFSQSHYNTLCKTYNLSDGFYKIRDCNGTEIVEYFCMDDEFGISKHNVVKYRLDLSKTLSISKFNSYDIIELVHANITGHLLIHHYLYKLSYDKGDDKLYLTFFNGDGSSASSNDKIEVINLRNIDICKDINYYKNILSTNNYILVNIINLKNVDEVSINVNRQQYFICKCKKINNYNIVITNNTFETIVEKYGIGNIKLDNKVLIKVSGIYGNISSVFELSNDEIVANTDLYYFTNIVAKCVDEIEYDGMDTKEIMYYVLVPNNYYKNIMINIYSTDNVNNSFSIDDSKNIINNDFCYSTDDLKVFVTANNEINTFISNDSTNIEFFTRNSITKSYFNFDRIDLMRDICDNTDAIINYNYIDNTEFIKVKNIIEYSYFMFEELLLTFDFDNITLLLNALVSIIICKDENMVDNVKKYFPEYKLIKPTITILYDKDNIVRNMLKEKYNIYADDSNTNIVKVVTDNM